LAMAHQLASNSLHGVSQALARYLQKTEFRRTAPALSQIVEVPGKGVQATALNHDGTSRQLRLGSAAFCGLTSRAVDVSKRSVFLVRDDELLATFDLHEEPRPDAKAAIDLIRRTLDATMPQAASRLSMLSGDSLPSAQRTAEKIGWINHIDQLQAPCSANDKLTHLTQLKASGHQVAMVGDGMNDSPVMVAADVSIAPARGAALASVKADFLLTAQSLMPIAQALVQAHATMRIVKQNLLWALIYNAFSVPLAVSGALSPWMAGLGMALSSLLVLANSLRLKKGLV
jgi:P-type Cu2+ transporter